MMFQSELDTTDSPPVYAPILADIARARDEVRRAAQGCTPEKCVCREAHCELMLRHRALRSIQEVPLGNRIPDDEAFLARCMWQVYSVALAFIRRDRRHIIQQLQKMRERGLSEQEIAAKPPRTRGQKASDKSRALYIDHCLYSGRDPWEHREARHPR